jgi:pyroglutamyl-peptidase
MTRHIKGSALSMLVTGFGSYPGVRRNPTANLMQRVVARLNRRSEGLSAHGGELTVSYASARQELAALSARHAPDAILLLGLAASARRVRIERFARRLDSPLHPDSTGRGGAAHAGGTDLPLMATGLVEPALATLLGHGVRARLSPSAGRYLCNAVYAAALQSAAGKPVLFVHLPFPRGFRGKRPSRRSRAWQPTIHQLELALADIAKGLALQARCARTRQSMLA